MKLSLLFLVIVNRSQLLLPSQTPEGVGFRPLRGVVPILGLYSPLIPHHLTIQHLVWIWMTHHRSSLPLVLHPRAPSTGKVRRSEGLGNRERTILVRIL